MTLRQRDPRVECPAFLAFVRRHACSACGAPAPNQAAHLRFTDPRYPEKRAVGIGEKPSDRWAVPLCAECHLDAPDAQHKVGEHEFWKRVGVNPFELAANLYAQFERRRNQTAGERDAIVTRAVRMKRRRARRVAHEDAHKSGAEKEKPRQRSGVASDFPPKFRRPKRKWPSRPFPKGRGFGGKKP